MRLLNAHLTLAKNGLWLLIVRVDFHHESVRRNLLKKCASWKKKNVCIGKQKEEMSWQYQGRVEMRSQAHYWHWHWLWLWLWLWQQTQQQMSTVALKSATNLLK